MIPKLTKSQSKRIGATRGFVSDYPNRKLARKRPICHDSLTVVKNVPIYVGRDNFLRSTEEVIDKTHPQHDPKPKTRDAAKVTFCTQCDRVFDVIWAKP